MNYNNFVKCLFLAFMLAVVTIACVADLPPITPPPLNKGDASSDVEIVDFTDAGILGVSYTTDASVDSSSDASDAAVSIDMKPAFVEYVFNAMREWVPASSQCFRNCFTPGCVDSKYQQCFDDVETHHSVVAQTIVDVITEPDIKLPVVGTNNKVKSALLMASIAKDESGYRQKVDDCTIKGDHGASVGLWQTMVFDWATRHSICTDRSFALRYAIKVVNISFDTCKYRPFQDKLITYACGFCDEPPASEQRRHSAWSFGLQDSRRKTNRAMDYLKAHPFEYQ